MTRLLPASLIELLNGDSLESKVGRTLLVIAGDTEGWPRVASLSLGEALALDQRRLLLSLYESSRTTAAIRESGRALIHLAHEGGLVRVFVSAHVLSDPEVPTPGRVTFLCDVEQVEIDTVPYATVTSGIEFDLVSPEQALERWQRQLDELKTMAARL